jgi:hypothetical protein
VSTNAKVDFEIEVPGDLARLQLPGGSTGDSTWITSCRKLPAA